MNKINRYGFIDYYTCIFIAPLWVFPTIYVAALVYEFFQRITGSSTWMPFDEILAVLLLGILAYIAAHLVTAVTLAITLPLSNNRQSTFRLRTFMIGGMILGQSFTWIYVIISDQMDRAWALAFTVALSCLLGAIIGVQCHRFLTTTKKYRLLNQTETIDIAAYPDVAQSYNTPVSAVIATIACIPTTLLLYTVHNGWGELLSSNESPLLLHLIVLILATGFALIVGAVIASLLMFVERILRILPSKRNWGRFMTITVIIIVAQSMVLFVPIPILFFTLLIIGSIILNRFPPKRNWTRFTILAILFSSSLFLIFALFAIGDIGPYSNDDWFINRLIPYVLPISIVAGLVYTRSIYFPE